jgi:hypothetical protein
MMSRHAGHRSAFINRLSTLIASALRGFQVERSGASCLFYLAHEFKHGANDVTGDFGPGELRSDDPGALASGYVIAAAGLAAEQDDGEAQRVLDAVESVEAGLAEQPVAGTVVLLDVTLYVSGEPDTSPAVRQRIADMLTHAARDDGFRVRHLEVKRA